MDWKEKWSGPKPPNWDFVKARAKWRRYRVGRYTVIITDQVTAYGVSVFEKGQFLASTSVKRGADKFMLAQQLIARYVWAESIFLASDIVVDRITIMTGVVYWTVNMRGSKYEKLFKTPEQVFTYHTLKSLWHVSSKAFWVPTLGELFVNLDRLASPFKTKYARCGLLSSRGPIHEALRTIGFRAYCTDYGVHTLVYPRYNGALSLVIWIRYVGDAVDYRYVKTPEDPRKIVGQYPGTEVFVQPIGHALGRIVGGLGSLEWVKKRLYVLVRNVGIVGSGRRRYPSN